MRCHKLHGGASIASALQIHVCRRHNLVAAFVGLGTGVLYDSWQTIEDIATWGFQVEDRILGEDTAELVVLVRIKEEAVELDGLSNVDYVCCLIWSEGAD